MEGAFTAPPQELGKINGIARRFCSSVKNIKVPILSLVLHRHIHCILMIVRLMTLGDFLFSELSAEFLSIRIPLSPPGRRVLS
jgi:hypothetical protein